jgi:hypothetical protein
MTILKRIAMALATMLALVLASSGFALAGLPVPDPLAAVFSSEDADGTTDEGEAQDGTVEEEPEEDADVQNEDVPEVAQAGQDKAAERRAAAKAFTDAVRDWTACAKEAAAANGDDASGADDFDPHDVCGPNPHPHDYGLGGPEDGDDRDGDDGSGGSANVPAEVGDRIPTQIGPAR